MAKKKNASQKRRDSLINKLSKNNIPLDDVLSKAKITYDQLEKAHPQTIKKLEKFAKRAIERPKLLEEVKKIDEKLKVKKHMKDLVKEMTNTKEKRKLFDDRFETFSSKYGINSKEEYAFFTDLMNYSKGKNINFNSDEVLRMLESTNERDRDKLIDILLNTSEDLEKQIQQGERFNQNNFLTKQAKAINDKILNKIRRR